MVTMVAGSRASPASRGTSERSRFSHPTEADGHDVSDLIALVGLGGGFGERLVATVAAEWTARLRECAGLEFPEKVTAFRPEMAVHGRYGKPCPRCREPVQRIRYADNETNYCARCQTGGKLLADRGLSRLLGADWPRTLDELEALKRR